MLRRPGWLPLLLLLILIALVVWFYLNPAQSPQNLPSPAPSAEAPAPDHGPVAASDAACGDNLYQGARPDLPGKLAQGLVSVCYQGYASASSPISRTPMWSAEHLTPGRIAQARATERASAFYPEPSLDADMRGELADYRRSGLDRGHLSPSGDMPGHEEQRQSFSLANIAPQNSQLNRGPWSDLESHLRDYVQSKGEIWVVTGVLFLGETINTTPDGRVMVPSSFWKAVLVPGRGALVFVAPNKDGGRIDRVSLADFTQRTGITPFPRLDAPSQTQIVLGDF